MTANAFAFGWAGGTPPGPPPWVPGTITGLVLGLETDTGLSGSTWTDQSTYAHTATIHGSPGAGTAINGKATLQLNGSTKYITVPDAAELSFGNDAPWAVFMVAVPQSGGGVYQGCWDKSSAGQSTNFSGFVYSPGPFMNIAYTYGAGGVYTYTAGGPGTGSPLLLGWAADGGGAGGHWRAKYGATVETLSQDTTLGAGSGTAPLTIGALGGPAFPAQIDLAAIYMYKGNEVTGSDLTTLVSYINAKYGSIG